MNQLLDRGVGPAVALSGDQVRFVRTLMGESQPQFAQRFAVSGQTIYRIEAKGDQLCRGPEIILIDQLVKQLNVQLPDSFPWRVRANETGSMGQAE